MYDQLRSEYESMKRSAIQPTTNFYSRPEPDLFSNQPIIMDNRDTIRKGNPVSFIMDNSILLSIPIMIISLIE